MDDNDDDKKRVLTPPTDWSEGLKPTSSDDYEDDIDESTDWLEDDDFEVPPASELDPDSDDVTADDGADDEDDNGGYTDDVSDSAALLSDHTATAKSTGGSAKMPWALAVIGFVAAAAMAGLWLDTQNSNSAEIADLKDTIRSLQRVENEKASEDTALAADSEALRSEIASLQAQTEALKDENELLKNRGA